MKEKVSELMDGALDERAAVGVLDALGRDAQARDAWRTYHLIGDAMRGTPPLGRNVASRVAWKLQDEPAVLAPQRRPAQSRWLIAPLPLAASLSAVALVGWMALAPQEQPVPVAKAPAGVLPQVRQAVAVSNQPVIVPLPVATSDYLLAHQGFSPRVSLQGMAPYVRTVSEPVRDARK